jgi:hypothetical protein
VDVVDARVPVITSPEDSIYAIAGHLQPTGSRETIRSVIVRIAAPSDASDRFATNIREAPRPRGI